jgi:zinc and cadmium transporter
MSLALLLTVYCACVLAASLVGGLLPSVVTLTHRRMQLVMSFVGGMMLGVALLHLLPHSLVLLHSIDRTAAWIVAGLVTMFLLIRVFHVHAHEHGDTSDVMDIHQVGHEGPCEHHHEHHDHGRGQHPFSWVGLGLGLSLHTLIDGVALGAAVMAEAHDDAHFRLLGLGTFLAVALHKPLDALSITSLMAAGGWSRRAIQLANIAFGLLCPLAVIASAWGFTGIGSENSVVGMALAFAAGVFLCISLADLLPEVAFHAHDRFLLTVALLAGIALAWSIGFFEPAHTHEASHKHHEHASATHAH